jgi:hypothetical protein
MNHADRQRLSDKLRMAEEYLEADQDWLAVRCLKEAREIVDYPATPPEQRTIPNLMPNNEWLNTPARGIDLDHINTIWETRDNALQRTRRWWYTAIFGTCGALILLGILTASDNPKPPEPIPNGTNRPTPQIGPRHAIGVHQGRHALGTPGNGLRALLP